MSKSLIILILFQTVCLNAHAQSFTEEEILLIDSAAQALIGCRNLPGLGVSLVRNGSVFYKGYGKARLDPPVAFDELTVTNIGSTVKAFTAALLGVLITESKQKGGSLDWTSKVSDILGPNFQTSVDFFTTELTIKDILTHRTGFGNQDLSLLTVVAPISRESYASRIKYLPLAHPFRDVWDYNNFMYVLAGYVAEVIGGKKYETLIKEKILDPLGMNAIFIDDVSLTDEHFAYPYFNVNGNLEFNGEEDFNLYRIGVYSPAGGLCTSPKELSKWLTFMLGNGTTEDGLTLIDKTVFDEMFYPHVALPKDWIDYLSVQRPFPIVSIVAWYGYGWFGGNYRGHDFLWHSGGLNAFTTLTSFFPDTKSGYFLTANGPWPMEYKSDLEPLTFVLSDILLQEDPWCNASSMCTFPEPWDEPPEKTNETVVELLPDSYDATPCVGSYGHRMYGDITVSDVVNGSLPFKLNIAGFGNFTPMFLDNSTFRINLQGRMPLVFYGVTCEARFDELTDGLFQVLHMKCDEFFGEYNNFRRGVHFLGDDDYSSSSVKPTVLSMSLLYAFTILLFLYKICHIH